MMINLSNHPSGKWDKAQLEVASQYGELIDISFPNILPEWRSIDVFLLAKKYVSLCLDIFQNHPSPDNVVHIAGELLFCIYFVSRLQDHGISVITSTTERNVVIDEDGVKKSVFKFVQFREVVVIDRFENL